MATKTLGFTYRTNTFDARGQQTSAQHVWWNGNHQTVTEKKLSRQAIFSGARSHFVLMAGEGARAPSITLSQYYVIDTGGILRYKNVYFMSFASTHHTNGTHHYAHHHGQRGGMLAIVIQRLKE